MTWRSHNGETTLEIRQGDALAVFALDAFGGERAPGHTSTARIPPPMSR